MQPGGDRRFCSGCGQPMEWRLGRWECTACGQTDDPAATAAAQASLAAAEREAELKNNVRGIQRKPIYRDGKVVGYESSDQAGSYTAPPPAMLGARSSDFDPYAGAGGADGGLENEKKLWLGSYLGVTFLNLIFTVLWFSDNPMYGFMADASPVAMGVGGVIGICIAGFIYYWVLTSSEIWAKWTCTGCNSCGLLLAIIGLFGPVIGAQDTLQPGWMQFISNIIQIGLTGWLISILYRDIQQRQGG